MTLHQLRIFSAVARHLNLSRAAKEVHISEPSVFYQLKLLQEKYKLQLYRRIGQGIQLTEKGRSFLSDAEQILFQVKKLKEKFGSNPTERKAEFLTVGGSRNPSASLLPTVIAVFRKDHPEVEITLRTDTSPAVQRLVLNSKVDIAVLTNPSESPCLVYEPCRQEQLVIFASTKHPLAKKDKLTLAELAQAPLVFKEGKAGEPSMSEQILKQVERRGLRLNIVVYCELPEAIKAAVRAGIGLGVSYRDIVEPDLRGGDLKAIDVPELKTSINSFIIYHKERPLSFPAQEFLTLLREWSQKSRWSRGSQRTARPPSASLPSRSPA
jgi:DNA-binding transcriptional LysR family regulator